jgi:AraC-like DNA-binding protein
VIARLARRGSLHTADARGPVTLTRTSSSPAFHQAAWRMALAADLLRTTDLRLAAIARRVGYDSEFAFAAAFKRIRGQAPGRYRAAQQQEAAETG